MKKIIRYFIAKVKKIKEIISIYFIFSKTELKQNYFAYKSRFILWVCSNTIILLIQVFLWIAIFDSSNSSIINGFNETNIINYTIFSKIVESATFVSFEAKVSADYNNGNIVMSLTRPIDYKKELLFRSFGAVLGSILLFSPIYIFLGLIFNKFNIMNLNLLNIIISIIFIIISFILNYYLCIIFSSFIFKTVKSKGLYSVKITLINLLSGALVPVEFFPKFIKPILNYSPMIYLRYIPVSICLGKVTAEKCWVDFFIGIFWIFIFSKLSDSLWNKQIKNIIIFGG